MDKTKQEVTSFKDFMSFAVSKEYWFSIILSYLACVFSDYLFGESSVISFWVFSSSLVSTIVVGLRKNHLKKDLVLVFALHFCNVIMVPIMLLFGVIGIVVSSVCFFTYQIKQAKKHALKAFSLFKMCYLFLTGKVFDIHVYKNSEDQTDQHDWSKEPIN